MPHVFTLEGAQFAQTTDLVVNFPSNGEPLAPSGEPIGPPRVPTPVFGPGGTPIMYRRQFPNRGPVCDYAEPQVFVGLGSGTRLGPRGRQMGDAITFLGSQSPIVAGAIVTGAALLTGALLGGLSIWIQRRVKPASR